MYAQPTYHLFHFVFDSVFQRPHDILGVTIHFPMNPKNQIYNIRIFILPCPCEQNYSFTFYAHIVFVLIYIINFDFDYWSVKTVVM